MEPKSYDDRKHDLIFSPKRQPNCESHQHSYTKSSGLICMTLKISSCDTPFTYNCRRCICYVIECERIGVPGVPQQRVVHLCHAHHVTHISCYKYVRVVQLYSTYTVDEIWPSG